AAPRPSNRTGSSTSRWYEPRSAAEHRARRAEQDDCEEADQERRSGVGEHGRDLRCFEMTPTWWRLQHAPVNPSNEYGLRSLRDARLERGAERLAYRHELDPVEHVLEEAADDQALGLG